MKKLLVTGCLLLSLLYGSAQNITNAEYFFDLDPGPGNATPITGFGSDDTLSISTPISTSGLSHGFHFLAVRVKDANNRWSHFEKRGFYIQATPMATPDLLAAEYFFDQDPGVGNATPLSIGMSNDSIQVLAMIPEALAGGFHTLAIRVKDQQGRWSLFEKRTFYVSPAPVSMTNIVAAEYFIGVDPGVGNGIPVSTGSPDDTITQPFTIPIPSSTPLGTYLYTIRVKDVTGKWSHFKYDTVIVAISVPEDTILNAAPGLCSKVVSGIDAEVINAEPYSYTLTGATTGGGSGSASGLSFNTGVTTVTYSLDNFPTAFNSFTVTIFDTEIPTITCPANTTIGADADVCGAIVNYMVFFDDNCPGSLLSLLSGLPSGSVFPTGSTTNTFRVTDASGNSLTCSFTITVVDDVPPIITCPANVTVNTDPGLCTASNVSLGTPLVNDNCGIAVTSNNGLSIYPVGITNVLWTTTDLQGLTATCVQTVTVLDTESPVITDCPQNIVTTTDPGDCSAAVNFSFAGTDNCGLQNIISTPFQSGEQIPPGIHLITILATDIHGNTSSCTFTIEITDDESPQITCPAQINEYTDPGNCNGIVNFNFLTSDNCFPSPTILSNPASGSAFPVGSTIVSSTATDISGNSQSCTFMVTIADEEPPTIICPAPITVNTDVNQCDATGIALGFPITDDNCGVASTTNTGLSTYPLGVTTVFWTVTDIHGLSASCVQTVTVVDNQVPQLTCPGDINVFAGPGPTTIVNYDTPTASDNCPFFNIIQTAGLPSGSAFPIGNTVNTFVATDASGNSSSCSFTVNVRIGRVGVNTTNPLAILHVADSSVLFSGIFPLPTLAPPPPASGAGIRTMWYPAKGAFRTGRAVSTEWDQDSIGLFSFAAGESVKAKGKHSISIGDNTLASSDYAVAMGRDNAATGIQSIALGAFNNSIGSGSTTMGMNNIAIGHRSTAMGFENISTGNESLTAGNLNQALGRSSAVFGKGNIGNAFSTFTIGQYCDTLNASRLAWVTTDPLFIIGNGSSDTSRRNALMLLKNGNTGLNTSSPSFRLHVTNDNPNDGGYAEGIMIENTDVSSGEAVISFRNKDIPGNRQWMTGLNQAPPHLAFAYGASFAGSNTHMVIDTSGQVGINVITPQAPLHIIRNLPSGGTLFSTPLAAFESNTISYLHLSSMTSNETGVVSGNQSTLHRSGMIFTADSSIHFTTGGDNLHLKVNKNGNVGINSSSPSARLEVNGSSQLGIAGSPLQDIIKVTVNLNVPSISNNATHTEIVSINNVLAGSTVFVSQAAMLPDGLIIASARVSSTDQVEIRFINKSGGAVDPAAMNYYIAIIR